MRTLKNFTFLKRGTVILTMAILMLTAYVQAQSFSFSHSALNGTSSFLPTSLQFGPDNRLYVAQQDGTIYAYTVVRNAPNNYTVIGTETILKIKQLPNHNDDGSLNVALNERQCTGILVLGTSSNPVIYASSSDPREGAGPLGNDTNLDTNSGIVTRLTWNGSTWEQLDLVRGLPRSEENHSVNGMVLDEAENILYLAVGGNTNMGAPSNNFANIPEYAYAAGILSIDLDMIGESTYDVPTLDDEDRPGTEDFNDPFGGNNGKNQGMLVEGGPVQVYASGFRNPYDLTMTTGGKMYAWDNGPNAGWGAPPVACLNNISEPGVTYQDNLHLITPGMYGGHPNPTRGNINNTFNPTNPQAAVPASMENPVECTYLAPGTDGSIVTNGNSTNGIDEYTASNFGGELAGYILAGAWDGKIYKVELNATGDGPGPSGKSVLFSGFGSTPLDVVTQGDGDIFPGTIWSANIFGDNAISVFEPSDYDGGGGGPCDLSDMMADSDGDGYTNGDELDNLSDPCSPASQPDDNDNDNISDLNDPDDDNDLISDTTDLFALDPDNGTTTFMPINYTWDPGAPDPGGILSTGFYGLMTNYTDNYHDLFDILQMTAGGTAGLLTIDNVPAGDAFTSNNTQQFGLQFGVNVDTVTQKFYARTQIQAPFAGFTPADFQSMGIYIGTGDQDNYIKITTSANGGAGGITVTYEENGMSPGIPISQTYNAPILGAPFVDLFLTVDPVALTVQPSYSIAAGVQVNVGSPRPIPASWVDDVLAVGLISTSFGPGAPFAPTWDFIQVSPLVARSSALVTVNPGDLLEADCTTPGSFSITNVSAGNRFISQVFIDLEAALLPDLVFDPAGTAGDDLGKALTVDAGDVATGYVGGTFLNPKDNGYQTVRINFTDFGPGETFTFSVDIDPSSIQGSVYPGPNNAGLVSGLEMSGAGLRVKFQDAFYVTNLFQVSGNDGASSNLVGENLPLNTPMIELLGSSSDTAYVDVADQVIRIHGTPGAAISLLVAEGGQFLDGVPGGGFNVGELEANKIINYENINSNISFAGFVDVPVELFQTNYFSGINYIQAVIKGNDGSFSDISNKLTIKVDTLTRLSQVHLNAGGPSVVASNGTQFIADKYFSNTFTFSNFNIVDVLNTDDDTLYLTERSSNSNLKGFSYNIPMVNGEYQVLLHFAEIFYGATGGAGGGGGGVGSRVFNVDIEGENVLMSYDLFAEYGSMTAHIDTFTVNITDEYLNIYFYPDVNRPKVSAIEVIQPCSANTLVQNLISSPKPNGTGVDLAWQALNGADLYQAKGRKVGTLPFGQFVTANNFKIVGGLQTNTMYEWYVRARCVSGPITGFSPLDTFTTANPGARLAGTPAMADYLYLYPVPADQELSVIYNGSLEGNGEYIITDLTGRVVLNERINVVEGNNYLTIDLSKLPNGIYFFAMGDGFNQATEKFVISR